MTRSICFVGSDVYPVLNQNFGSEYIGGESVQLTLIAKAFSDLGWRVSLIDTDYGQPDGEIIDGITVYKTFRKTAGIPIVRFFYPRLFHIFMALKKADADIYYQSTAIMMTGVVAWFCRRHKKRFVFRTAHDDDCIRGGHQIKFWRDRKLYEYGLRRADLISVQGVNQEKLLYKNYGLKGFPVNMAVEIPVSVDGPMEKDIDCLWVNNMRPFKRPELFVELAKSLPDYRFVMIGGPLHGLERYYEQVSELARQVRNLDFIGPVPYHEVNSYFLRAKVFANTSESEGFPNSFLQAWIRKVPVISFFDPDGLISSQGLGVVPTGINDMATSVRNLLKDNYMCQSAGNKAREFVLRHYAPESVVKGYILLFNKSYLIRA